MAASVPALAGVQVPDSPAGQVLAAVAGQLRADGYGFSVPEGEGRACLRVAGGRRAVAGLSVTGDGRVTWDYRFGHCPYLEPGRVAGVAVDLLDPDRRRRAWGPFPDHGAALPEVAGCALLRHGFAVAARESAESGVILTARDPDQPCRGTVRVTGLGELRWDTWAPHHRDGGIPVPDIAAAISRALARVRRYPGVA
jgi:hypothetical protein